MTTRKNEVEKVLEVARGALKNHVPVLQALENALRSRDVPCDQVSSGTVESLAFPLVNKHSIFLIG
jgi:hypothetical protein